MTDEYTHPGYTHSDGTQCVLLEDGTWFVPLDAGGEGYPCEQGHGPQTVSVEEIERQFDELEVRIQHTLETCDKLAATVLYLMNDAHPTYGSTTGWHGGIGGQAMTPGCSVIDPPPGFEFLQMGYPTAEARAWILQRLSEGTQINLREMISDLEDGWRAEFENDAVRKDDRADS